MTGLIHDWGMLMIPHDIRDPAQAPTRIEEMEIEKHCSFSQDIIEKIPQLPTLVSLLSYQVHERIDGTGYPRRKSVKGIHLFARILHIAHEYCFLTTPTKYRQAFSPHIVMTYLLRDERKVCRDPLVMRGLLRHHSLFPVGSYVLLSNHKEAKVIRTNGDQYFRPIVEITKDATGEIMTGKQDVVDLLNCELSIIQALPTPGRLELMDIPGRLDQAHSATSGSHLTSQEPYRYTRRIFKSPSAKQSLVTNNRRSNLLRG
jgi:hypothetical protein